LSICWRAEYCFSATEAAIYARVSSDRQKEEQTIASQTAFLQEYAEAKGYAVPALQAESGSQLNQLSLYASGTLAHSLSVARP
jgi:predicted site-specific integrase-resolvase